MKDSVEATAATGSMAGTSAAGGIVANSDNAGVAHVAGVASVPYTPLLGMQWQEQKHWWQQQNFVHWQMDEWVCH